MKKIAVMGGGVLGSQIAFQTAYCGFDVTVWLLDDENVKITQGKIDTLKENYINDINEMAEGKTWCHGLCLDKEFNKEDCLNKVNNAINNIRLVTDLKDAVKDADLVIESIIENEKVKADFFKKLSLYLDSKTIVVTNSSTLLPSKLSKHIIRPDRFLSLHFANMIWKNNTAEVMAHPKTDMKCFDEVMEFAKQINMVALPLKKEKNGYLLNSMLIPLLFSAMDLYVNGISDYESIDIAWKKGTGAPKGPFEILDVVGMETAYNIVKMYLKVPSFLAPYNFKAMEKLLKKYIDEGKLGKATKEGFYKY